VSVDLGPTQAWGFPSDRSRAVHWPSYHSAYAERAGDGADLVLVDGRFRVACVLTVLLHSSAPLLLVHDWERPEYHVVLPFVELLSITERLAVMRRRGAGFDRLGAQALLARHSHELL
jgi:hypothetical protein